MIKGKERRRCGTATIKRLIGEEVTVPDVLRTKAYNRTEVVPSEPRRYDFDLNRLLNR